MAVFQLFIRPLKIIRSIDMKRLRIYSMMLTVFGLSYVLPAMGQIGIGVQLGTHSGVYSGVLPDSIRFRPALGTVFGIHLDYEFSNDVALSISPQIVNEKVQLQQLVQGSKKYQDSITLTTSYFTLPVQVQIISDNRKFRYLAGLDLNFPQSIKSNDEDGNETERRDVLKDFTLGASFGIGWRKEIDRSLITIDLIYNQGLLNLTSAMPEEPWYSQLKGNSLRLILAYTFVFKKKGGSNE